MGKTKLYAPTLHPTIYAVADKYDVNGLKEFAASMFEKSCAEAHDPVFSPDVVRKIYDTTVEADCKLRDLIIRTSVKHYDELLTSGARVQLMDQMTNFKADMLHGLKESTDESENMKNYHCRICGMSFKCAMADFKHKATFCIGCKADLSGKISRTAGRPGWMN